METLEVFRENCYLEQKFKDSPDIQHPRRQKLIEDYEKTVVDINRLIVEIEKIDSFTHKKEFDAKTSEYRNKILKINALEKSICQEFHLVNVRKVIEDFKNGLYDEPPLDDFDDDLYY